jgi:hypothetical protein
MAANTNLKNALQDARLTLEEFAAILSVDPKSVGRWIAGTSTRTRVTVPPTVELDGESSTSPRPSTSDHLRAWADGDSPTAPDPVEFIAGSDGPVDILDTDTWFELAGPVADALIAHAAAGHQVRVASNAPLPNLAPLIRQAGIELRCVDANEPALIRTASALLIATRLGGFADQSAALFYVEADGSNGFYDRLDTLFETLWQDPVEIITTVDQLELYRTNAYDDLEDNIRADPKSELDNGGSSAARQPDVSRPPVQSAQPARRGPG